VSGKSISCRETGRRPGDPPVLVADPGLAAELLGWEARVSDLDTIVRTALAWHVSRSAQFGRAEQNS
jgi:UDP-glucose 4-epimerase